MINKKLIILTILAVSISTANALVVYVPGEFPNIQLGINSCADGDTVYVLPGRYTGLGNTEISTQGRAILVKGIDGALSTVIDCEAVFNGFLINSDEDSATIISDFTIINAYNGIECDSTSPTFKNLIIYDFIYHGIQIDGGQSLTYRTPRIENCVIGTEDYARQGVSGIYARKRADVTITGCIVHYNLYGMEFYTSGGYRPLFNVTNCEINNNASVGVWTHA